MDGEGAVRAREQLNQRKREMLHEIAELVDLQEAAIAEHPPRIGAVYRKYRDAFMDGLIGNRDSIDTERLLRSLSLSFDEWVLMSRYMLSSSFISDFSGDKARRDRAAHSCAELVVAGEVGLDAMQIMRQYIALEQRWHRTMKSEGIDTHDGLPSSGSLCPGQRSEERR